MNYCLFERLTNWDQVFQVGAIKELFFMFRWNTFTIASELLVYLVYCFLFRTLYKVTVLFVVFFPLQLN